MRCTASFQTPRWVGQNQQRGVGDFRRKLLFLSKVAPFFFFQLWPRYGGSLFLWLGTPLLSLQRAVVFSGNPGYCLGWFFPTFPFVVSLPAFGPTLLSHLRNLLLIPAPPLHDGPPSKGWTVCARSVAGCFKERTEVSQRGCCDPPFYSSGGFLPRVAANHPKLHFFAPLLGQTSPGFFFH